MLHGLFGLSDNLRSLGSALSVSHDVLLPDLASHGRSFHRREMSLTELARDVLFLMDELEERSFAVVGHSLGGKIGMQMALLAPERVVSLVVLDIAPVTYPDRHSCFFPALQQVRSCKPGSRSEAEKILEQAGIPLAYRHFFLKSLKRGADGHWDWCFGLDEIIHAYGDLCSAPGMTKPFWGPVLFLAGEKSGYITDRDLPELTRFFPNAAMKTIPDAGHWIHVDQPEQVQRLVADFIASY